MIGNKVILLKEINSTNNYASELIDRENPPEGTVVMADFQDQGKGQRESTWESEEGKNILCSIILYPQFMLISNQFALNQAISIGVTDTIWELTGLQPQIKWPNDILVNEKKISGILIENNLRGQNFLSSIIGIGLNLNQMIFKNPAYAAVSIASLAGRFINKTECYQLLFSKLDFYYELLRKNELQIINELYMDKLFRLNEEAMYEINGKPYHATIRGVKSEGELIFEMPDGQIRYIRTKEVKYLY